MQPDEPDPTWKVEDSAKLYHVNHWAGDFFSIQPNGEVAVRLSCGDTIQDVSLAKIARDFADKGTATPMLLRFPDILARRIRSLNDAFEAAIRNADGTQPYRGVFPIKVNQQRQVIEHITAAGESFDFGLEVGTKPELVIAMTHLGCGDRYLVCNGYKDGQYVDLALNAAQIGIQTILVVERLPEVALIVERAKELGVRPRLGLRTRLTAATSGHWSATAGEQSLFGLGIHDMIAALDQLKKHNMLDCLEMLHYHQGSQIPDIRSIETTAREAAKIYCGLVQEGAPMGLMNVGGGLAIDYDGSGTTSPGSRNYDLESYANAIVGTIIRQLDNDRVAHPILMSESGRAIAAPYSVLVFDVIGTGNTPVPPAPPTHKTDIPPQLDELAQLADNLDPDDLKISLNRGTLIVKHIYDMFELGEISLRVRALAEHHFTRLRRALFNASVATGRPANRSRKFAGETAGTYYGNFSLFQSLPDSWAINQLFPVVPLQRLHEKPNAEAVIADITCDCDGRIKRYIDPHDDLMSLTVPRFRPGESYYIGVFLVGAYQETLGDLHNLLGYPHTVAVSLNENGGLDFEEISGDKISDVLNYVEYEPKAVLEKFRRRVRNSPSNLSDLEVTKIERACAEALESYTYLNPK